MTFVEFLKLCWENRTKSLGYIQSFFGVLSTSTGVFGPKAMSWILLISGLLTVTLGFVNDLLKKKSEVDTPPADGQAVAPPNP